MSGSQKAVVQMKNKLIKQSVLLGLLVFAPFVCACGQYKHKTESQLAGMTSAQRVEEYANEQAHHKYDFLDEQSRLILKYIRQDGRKALPPMVLIIDQYDPTTVTTSNKNGERFDAMWMLLGDLDSYVIRVRATDEGRTAIDRLQNAINRMNNSTSAVNDHWATEGRLKLATKTLEDANGIGFADRTVRDTFWIQYKVQLSDEELLKFSNFLVARDPNYPSWSQTDFIKDFSRINDSGNPLQVYVMKNPSPFYNEYLEFKKSVDSRGDLKQVVPVTIRAPAPSIKINGRN
ncbi:MAG TPA: hypothetical protein VJV03_16275 [Pyrinomonadaceae bacterium]|nr:hypothetical protein [Pyrinomonadaceae bacterium]